MQRRHRPVNISYDAIKKDRKPSFQSKKHINQRFQANHHEAIDHFVYHMKYDWIN
ncbi:hypothetical protein [Tuberibacillus sp. Marseille-P3662]|uniref:hypothetical protein n=1 Tax=Tuberibacillus sp. Marseille-P3662 TaxID=1965358 RepID=UPI00159336C5|nr:hypothetical protein [Tuberibacillus sp. Marseille-P3662]